MSALRKKLLYERSRTGYQWKMSFNLDLSKQVQDAIFIQKVNKPLHIPLVFNNSSLVQINCQKHLGMILDSRITFNKYLENVLGKENRGIYNM